MIAAGVGATIDPERLLWVPGQMVTVPAMPNVNINMAVDFNWIEIDAIMKKAYDHT
jgi:hypothetical protein